MKTMKILSILAIICMGSTALAEDESFKYVMCKNKSIVRTVRVEWQKKVEECTTTYTKNGLDKVIGNGRFFDSCVGILNNVQVNLEKAGWSCKDISNASIHKGTKVIMRDDDSESNNG